MGVTWVFEADQTAKSLERILESNGAELIGSFVVDITPYTPPTTPNTEFSTNYVMHHSKCPQSTFSICQKENFKKSPKAVADRGFDLILGKLSNGLTVDNAGKIEINGNEFRIIDWTIRVGTATQGTTVKGVLVEVEFDASVIVVQCRDMMAEFIKTVFTRYHEPQPEIFIITEKPENYTPLDTMWQYLVLAGKLRKKT